MCVLCVLSFSLSLHTYISLSDTISFTSYSPYGCCVCVCVCVFVCVQAVLDYFQQEVKGVEEEEESLLAKAGEGGVIAEVIAFI